MTGSMMEPFSVGAGLVALLAGTARGAYVEYTTYENSDCTNVISVSVYAGVPAVTGVQVADTCLDYEESTTTTFVEYGETNGDGIVSFQHVCNTTEPGLLTTVWYSADDCDETTVLLEFAEDDCTATCTADEPEYGSDEFEDSTVTFYDSSDCTNATETEVYTVADLYDLFGMEGATTCSASGDFDFYTVLHCSDGSPAAVYYEDDECTGDIVGMTYNAGCAPVPTNGTYPGDYFTAECTESAAAVDDDEEEEEEDVNDASGATLSHGFGCGPRGLVPGAVASASFAATAVAAVAAAVIF
ncbi:unnamed protein product [Pylaiella littoralis]